jgi:UDP-glucuronate 4-epimerase
MNSQIQNPQQTFLVTGALGCIGAWVTRLLTEDGKRVVVLDQASDPYRLHLIMNEEQFAQVQFVAGDITDLPGVERVLHDYSITHVIHLAGLQVPACKANPALGALVNVVGTVNIFEAARRAGLQHIVYASSVAVYGHSEEYEGIVGSDAPLHPSTHYGVYKQANEGTARIYWQNSGLSSIGLRPYTVFGPGRDQGLTSAPTKAMLAAARGENYHIPFGGRVAYQYVADTARIFIRAAQTQIQGAEVFNLRGSVVSMPEMIAAIEQAAPSARDLISYDDQPLPFPENLDDAPLREVLGDLNYTPLVQAVAETIAIFQKSAMTSEKQEARS